MNRTWAPLVLAEAPARAPPTPEQIARQLMRILVLHLRLKPDDEIPDRPMRREYEALGGKAYEIATGLRFAHQSKWVTYARSTDRFYMTTAGVSEAA